eukprot:TRINITY_DN4517_c0_g1_i2.p1 TRINITY_DN4517_c0_g1~~TRINITY_DN4517_c0_g1_i2.p1  ORF type:complete len:321 (+),score=60.50 TRINITY_DN4517_c0_g1_i2:43-1005(+)
MPEHMMQQGGTMGVSKGRRSTTPQASPKHSSPQRNAGGGGGGGVGYGSPGQVDDVGYSPYISSPQHADIALSEASAPLPSPEVPVPVPMSFVNNYTNQPDIPAHDIGAWPMAATHSAEGLAAASQFHVPRNALEDSVPGMGPSESWKYFASVVEENGIAECDIGELQWSSVEKICFHLGISDPFMIAEIQKDWRLRHTGTDNPLPIQLSSQLTYVPPVPAPVAVPEVAMAEPFPVPVPIPVPVPPVAAAPPVNYIPLSVDPYGITENPFLRGITTSVPIGPPLARISSPQHKGPIILSEPTPNWKNVKSRIDTGKKKKRR